VQFRGGLRTIELPPRIPDAAARALECLVRHQDPDGGWSSPSYTRNCGEGGCKRLQGNEDFSLGVTGLADMAFLRAGVDPRREEDRRARALRRALRYIVSNQDPSGRFGRDDTPKYMYNHLIATVAVLEAHGRTRSLPLEEAAERAIGYTLRARNPRAGWRYSFRSGDNDSSVTGCGAMALAAARQERFEVPAEAAEGVLAWYDSTTDRNDFRVGYADTRISACPVIGGNQPHADHPTTTAIGGWARLTLGRLARGVEVRGGIDVVIGDLPEWDGRSIKADHYYWFWGTEFMAAAANPAYWKKWRESAAEALGRWQSSDPGACEGGSWPPGAKWTR
jgi:hypothetical protein